MGQACQPSRHSNATARAAGAALRHHTVGESCALTIGVVYGSQGLPWKRRHT